MSTKTIQSVHEDLQEVVKGDLLFDDLSRALYSTDASIYQVQPLGVVVPRDEEDVQAVVRYAAQEGLSVTARGAASGVAGESLNRGLILDFSKHFREIGVIQGDTVRVQPGVVYRELNRRLGEIGRRFAPDPASGAQCTIGGMLANNASGARAIKHGYTRDHVVELRVVFDNGEVEPCGREPRRATNGVLTRKGQLLAELIPLLEQHEELIRACRPRTPFNRCGYLLHDVLGLESLDLARLLVGSEGTLGLFTEATLRTVPLAAERALTLLGFPSLEKAASAAPWCVARQPAACELLDRRLLTLTCGSHPEYDALVSRGTEAVLLVEFESECVGEARQAALELARRAREQAELTTAHTATGEAEVAWLWRLRDLALPMLHAMPGRVQPVPFIEDVGVPPEQLAEFLFGVQEILQRHETTASFLVHAGAGQVHTRPFLDLRKPDNVSRLKAVADGVYRLALDLGGTISTQHAVGLARTPWVGQQYGRLIQVLRDVKGLFDPRNLFNPGKIVGNDGELTRDVLRREFVPEASPREWRLRWNGEDGVQTQCHACNGCGACRTESPGQRMCPLFRVTHGEAATPRAKANLLRSLLDGGLPAERWTSDEVRATADLCINCKMCALECPAHVNVPKLMLESKAAHAAEHGLRRIDWLLSRLERFAALGSLWSVPVNAMLRSRSLRWLLGRLLGLSRRRKLPRFARRSFLRLAARRGWTHAPGRRGGKPAAQRVAYFVDTYANYFDPQLAEATVSVLLHNGYEVFVPPGQAGCGMAALAHGDVDAARRAAEKNLQVFADLARAGYTIVCSEPTAALMLRQDYGDLVEDPDSRLVAEHTRELMAFLAELYDAGRLDLDFQALDLHVGHHVPCHLKALQQGIAGPRLLALIPGLRSDTIDVSCSGMAGTFGLKEETFETSLAAGRPMLERLRQGTILFGSSECSACRMQMEQAGKRSFHPVQYLALAYGLMPELAERLKEPIPDLVLR